MISSWVNGQANVQSSVYDRGLQFGDGLFETLVFKDKQPILLTEHLYRLEQGAQRLNISIDIPLISSEITSCINQTDLTEGVLKLIVTRGDSLRGYAAPKDPDGNRYIYINPIPYLNPDHYQEGIDLHLCKTRLAIQPLLAGIKHLNRLEQVLARQEWDDEYQEGVLCNLDGDVIEGCMSNIFILHEGKLITPLTDQSGVAGIMAKAIIQLARENGIHCEQKKISLAQVQSAESIFLSNSVIGIWPVKTFMHKRYNISPSIKKMQTLIQGYF